MNARKAIVAALSTLCIVGGALAFAVTSSASAAETHVFETSFGPDGTPESSGEQFAAVGVDSATGDTYVADLAANTVQKFNAAHEPTTFTGVSPDISGSTLTGFSFITGEPLSQMGVNSVSHNFYVVNHGTQSLEAFQSDGEPANFTAGPGIGTNEIAGFTEVCGVAVDTNGEVYVADYFQGVKVYAASGELVTSIAVERDCNLAVDSQGNVYVNEFLGPVSKLVPSAFPVTGATTYAEAGVVDGAAAWGVAVDTANDHLYVDEHTQVAEYDETGTRIGAAFGAVGAGTLTASEGLAVNSGTGQIYVTDAGGKRQVEVFGPAVTLPTVATGEATNVEATSATLNGTVNPEGLEIKECKFEYVVAAKYEPSAANPYSRGATVPCAETPAEIGEGTSPVEVHAGVALLAGTEYHFRLVASDANGTESGADVTLNTPPPPSIDSAVSANLSSSAVDLTAKINPRGFDTTYHFEYGTSTAYGTSIPLSDADIGSGVAAVSVTQHVEGLSPNTTYHWRVVASSANGTTTSPDHVFTYDTSGNGTLPDDRAYEMVTPVQKNAALIGDVTFGVPPELAEDGSQLILGVDQCFGDAASCVGVRVSTGAPYSFTRSGGAWVANALAPAATQFEANSWSLFNADARTALFSAPTPPGGQDDFYARQPDGSFVDIGPLSPSANPKTLAHVLGASKAGTANLSHLVVSSSTPVWAFDPSESGTVYEYSGTGNVPPAFVGVRGGPGSTELISECATQLGGANNELPFGEMSADGRTILFTAKRTNTEGLPCEPSVTAPPVNELFARIDNRESDARTVAISQPSALSPTPPSPRCQTPACVENTTNTARFRGAQFVAASADGARVLFLDTQQLTDDASQDPNEADSAVDGGCSGTTGANGCNLYMYDSPRESPPSGENLTAISAGAATGGPRVQGVMALSTDGSHVYFVAKGVLTGAANRQGQTAQEDEDNLYVYERDAEHPSGHLAFIAVLPKADRSEWQQGIGRPANVTPDGRYLVFTSSGALTPDTTRTDGAQQVFRYDARSEQLIRISIGEQGYNDDGNAGRGDASIVPGSAGYTRLGPGRSDPTMSHDGAYVFFMSSVALTPGALDSLRVGTKGGGSPAYAQNVYEYHDGNVYLISDGRDANAVKSELCVGLSAVCLIGADATGANVFFATADQLVPQDTDTQIDFYDARICSSGSPCIASPPRALPPCLGEACHGTPPATPSVPAPGSASFSGAGNVTPAPPPVKPVSKPLTRAQKLSRALKSCRAKHNKHKRLACEKSARKRFAPKSKKSVKSKRASNKRRAKS